MDGYLVSTIVLGIAVLVLIVLAVLRRQQDYSQSFALLQQRIKEVEDQVRAGLESGNRSISEKFDNSLKVIGDIQKTIGSLEETNKRMVEIGKDISSLQDLLAPPKVRGEMGELSLGNLLGELLPRDGYEQQFRFRNGNVVDAVVKAGGRLLAIDSKFPLESFNRYSCSVEDKEKTAYLKDFCRSVKTKIDDIASKYILEDEDTFDFALMFVPSENVYYQTILRDEFELEGKSIAEYALAKRVVIVSPNSIYAYLRVILIGLRGLQVEKNARKILDDFGRINQELEKFQKQFETLGMHLTHAQNSFDGASRQLGQLSNKVSLAGQTGRLEDGPSS